MTHFTHRIRLGIAGVVLAALPGIAAARPIYTGPATSDREAALLKKYDLNHDGVLGPVERERMWAAQRDAKLDRYDANDNGKLGAAEQTALRIDRIERLIANFDMNRDGRLSHAEARLHDSHLVARFRLIDSNHDRLLSKRELIASPYVHTPVVNRRPWWAYWAPA